MEWSTTSTVLDQLGDFNNRGAWDLFTDRFRTPIVRFAIKMGLAESDAEDVAQQTLLDFANAYRAGKYDRAKGRLSKWLFGIAYRRAAHARMQLARRERQVVDRTDGAKFLVDIPDERRASESWNLDWLRAALDRCLERVRGEFKPTTYRAFELVALEKQSPADAAAQLDMTRNAVFVAKHRVASRLRILLREYEDVL